MKRMNFFTDIIHIQLQVDCYFLPQCHAGTNLEQIELVTPGKIIRVKNMNTFEIEQENSVSQSGSPSWDTTLKQRGFEDAVHHFINVYKAIQSLL